MYHQLVDMFYRNESEYVIGFYDNKAVMIEIRDERVKIVKDEEYTKILFPNGDIYTISNKYIDTIDGNRIVLKLDKKYTLKVMIE